MQSISFRPLALAALLCTGAAQGAVPYVTTHAFTLQGYENYPDSIVDVVSDTASSITLALPTFGAELSTGRADSTQGPGDPAVGQAATQAMYDIRPTAGYRITGLTLSGLVQGAVQAGGGDAPGFALNYLRMESGVWGWNGDMRFAEVSDLDGTRQLAVSSAALALESPFSIYLSGYTNLVAMGGYLFDPVSGDMTRTPSLAAIGLRDVTLTFTVSAVPEPQTWLLLLGGLGIVGALAARTRQRAPIC